MSLDLNMCRLCMEYQPSKELSNIFQISQDISLDIKAMACCRLSIQFGDGLPQFVCRHCEIKLHGFYDFKRQCETAEQKLKEFSRTQNVYLLEEDIKTERIECEAREEAVEGTASLVSPLPTPETEQKQFIKNNYGVKKKAPNERAQSFQCERCGRTFRLRASLAKHALTHSAEKLFACTQCPKRYTRAEHLTVHTRAHSGAKPFVCEVCARAFTKNQDLARHHRVHSDERHFPCLRCPRRFKRSADVHAHMRSHTGARPFVCSSCSKTYASHSGLNKHRRTQCH